MTTAISVMVGVGVLSFILIFIMMMLDKENPFHTVLRWITLGFIIAMLLLIPKASLDANTVCEVVVNQSIELNSTNTHYTYTDFCYNRTEGTSLTFYKAYGIYLRIFTFWMFIFFLGWLFMEGKNTVESIRRMWRGRL